MRGRNRRRVGYRYQREYFKPSGIPMRTLEETFITFEELEAMRLAYIEDLTQVNAASKMGISQSQYQRDLQDALRKITDALINQKALKVSRSDDQV